MKRNAFTAIYAIVTIVLSSLVTPCRAQANNSNVDYEDEPLVLLEDNGDFYTDVEYITQPEFPGGMRALYDYMKNELRYPKKCRKAKIEGRSLVKYIVEKDGRITDVEILASSGNKQLDKEAVRVIKKMPRWIPATQDNAPVRSVFALPVIFNLDEYATPVDNDKDVLLVAEHLPEYPGGVPALLAYLKNEIHYPKKCWKAGIEGISIVTFVVRNNGKIKDVRIQHSSGNKLLDKEAIRVIKKMPKWEPGMHEGKNVNVMFTLPIKFRLR